MDEDAVIFERVTLQRSRRGVARRFAQIMFALLVIPPVATMAGIFIGALFPNGDIVSLLASIWLYSWVPGVPVAMFVAAYAGVRGREHTNQLEVRDGMLRWLARERAMVNVPLPTIASALFIDSALPEAEINLVNGDVLHVISNDRSATLRLVSALGFGARERRTLFRTGPNTAEMRAGCISSFVASFGAMFGACGVAYANVLSATESDATVALGFLVAFLAVALPLNRRLTSRRIVIGSDAIVQERFFGSRIIPLASIVEAKITSQGAGVIVREGDEDRWRLLTSERGARPVALCDRIREVMEARAEGHASSALVARGSRTVEEWRAALHALAAGGGGYRREVVPVDVLLRVAESAEAPLDQRIGAALAIGLASDADAKKKLRVAVEGIANDDARDAMARAAEGTLDDAYLDEVTTERAVRMRR